MNIRFPTENITDVSFVVQWDAVINHPGVSYTVTWSNETGPIQTANVNDTSYTVIRLTPNTIYNVTVAAVNKYNCTGPVSADKQVTTDYNLCSCNCDSIINSTNIAATSIIKYTNTVATVTTSSTTTSSVNYTMSIGSDNSKSDSLSTGAAVAVTFVVTFIITLTVTAIVTFIVTYVYVKTKFCVSIKQSPQEKVLYEEVSSSSHTITKNELELQPNPAYDTNHKVIIDANPAYESCK